jgi:hypothetical protein
MFLGICVRHGQGSAIPRLVDSRTQLVLPHGELKPALESWLLVMGNAHAVYMPLALR